MYVVLAKPHLCEVSDRRALASTLASRSGVPLLLRILPLAAIRRPSRLRVPQGEARVQKHGTCGDVLLREGPRRSRQRLFKELFYRKGFQYDNMFDWTVLNLVRDHGTLREARALD